MNRQIHSAVLPMTGVKVVKIWEKNVSILPSNVRLTKHQYLWSIYWHETNTSNFLVLWGSWCCHSFLLSTFLHDEISIQNLIFKFCKYFYPLCLMHSIEKIGWTYMLGFLQIWLPSLIAKIAWLQDCYTLSNSLTSL